jgi:hypothetical protein
MEKAALEKMSKAGIAKILGLSGRRRKSPLGSAGDDGQHSEFGRAVVFSPAAMPAITPASRRA